MHPSAKPSALEKLLRRDRYIVIGALLLICAMGWSYTFLGIGMEMTAFEMTPNPFASSQPTEAMQMHPPQWTPSYALIMFTMWWFMMVAMMLPSAAPTVLLAAAINRRSEPDKPPFGPTSLFVTGYLLAWFIFSSFAVAAQWLLDTIGYLSSMMTSRNTYLTGGLLVAAGLWQLSPIKRSCLRHCRSPVDFLTQRRGRGDLAAVWTGLWHGTYCLGCCWFLMALLFVGGVMNLYWIVGLAAFVLIEKIAAGGVWFGQLSGVILIVVGSIIVFY